jgi:hypothetical protein
MIHENNSHETPFNGRFSKTHKTYFKLANSDPESFPSKLENSNPRSWPMCYELQNGISYHSGIASAISKYNVLSMLKVHYMDSLQIYKIIWTKQEVV